jgi:hypothetical protein
MPDFQEEIRRRLAPLELAPAREAEITEELSQHVEEQYQQALSGGATAEEARRAVLDGLNNARVFTRESSASNDGPSRILSRSARKGEQACGLT